MTAASVLAAARRLIRWPLASWRRSLQLRVVCTTLLASLVIVVLLGVVIFQQVRSGLLDNKVRNALNEQSAGVRMWQSQLDARGNNDLGRLVYAVTNTLTANLGGQTRLYEFVIVPSPGTDGQPPPGYTSLGIDENSVPAKLRTAVGTSSNQYYAYTTMRYDNGTRVPGLVVGASFSTAEAGAYQLYYLFPLNQEQQTLSLVSRTLTFAGIFLVLLLAGIAWLVARQVVTPVRAAARTAERLAGGWLEERMRVKGQDDLARLASSFNKMADGLQRHIRRLEELSRMQRRFVSDVSHELRTPLTTIRMAADVLYETREEFDPSVSRSAELLQMQLDRFEALLSDLLEISRHDAGAVPLEAEAIDLNALVLSVAEAAEPLAERRGSRIRLHLPAEETVCEADSRRISRILRNLLDNAIEHGEANDIDVLVAGDENAVAVAVRDHGVGLRPGEAGLVFNRFWRADPARARTTGGTGLGLSIALEDAHLHGGTLQAWGKRGVGSQFLLTLPRRARGTFISSPLALEPVDGDGRRADAAPPSVPIVLADSVESSRG
jgi:two-component system sensor histidine kinase MtrB